MSTPRIQHFFDLETFTLSYIISDPVSRDAILIDPVHNHNPASGALSDRSVAALVHYISSENLQLRMMLETHAHADHLSGAPLLKAKYPQAKLGIGARITEVQAIFKEIYNFGDELATDGRQFDHLFQDGEELSCGTLRFKVISTPGHTPACVSYLFGEALFTGDALFMPDYGTGRCDFPGGSAATLYDSIYSRLYKLPSTVLCYTAHDYMPGGRPLRFEASLGEHLLSNIHLSAKTTRADFIAFRTARDAKLDVPRLLHPSVQVNINAGILPAPESNGRRYLKVPLGDG